MNIKKIIHCTLLFPLVLDSVLLFKKSRGVGSGCKNGLGGGIHPNETPIMAAAREGNEESGGAVFSPIHLGKVAKVYCICDQDDGSVIIYVIHVFITRKWGGEFGDSDEMVDPKAYKRDNLPLDELQPGDCYWLAFILNGMKVRAVVHYNKFGELRKIPTVRVVKKSK